MASKNEFSMIQLHDSTTFDVSTLGFSKPVGNEHGGYRIDCGVVDPVNGSKSGLFLSLPPNLYSFGVKKFVKGEKGNEKVTWSYSISLKDRNNPTPEQEAFVDLLESIAKSIYNNMESRTQKMVTKHGKAPDYDTFLNSLVSYKKGEMGDFDKTSTPCVYAKLVTNQSKGTRISRFFDSKTDQLVPYEKLEDKPNTLVSGVLKISGVYLGNKITIQTHLWEGIVEVMDTSNRRLLSNPNVAARLTSAPKKDPTPEAPTPEAPTPEEERDDPTYDDDSDLMHGGSGSGTESDD